jgi:DNA-binding MarR family transcriptional regulator
LRPVLVHIGRQLRRELDPLHITAGQASLLAVIAAHPGVGVGELARRERMSAPTMCAHLDRLAAAGLVARTRAEDGDRRRVGLRVTADGDRLVRAVRSRRTAWLATRLAGLSAEERARIDAAVEALGRLVEPKS